MSQKLKSKIVGIDLFIQASFDVQLPSQIGLLKFKHIASRGTVLSGSISDRKILDVGWLCVRYLLPNATADGEANVQIIKAIETLGKDFEWSSAIKLYETDGKPSFI